MLHRFSVAAIYAWLITFINYKRAATAGHGGIGLESQHSERLRQEDLKFEYGLANLAKSCLKIKIKKGDVAPCEGPEFNSTTA